MQLQFCADQIALSTQTGVKVDFTTYYRAEDKTWFVQASSLEPALAFGRWQVSDTEGQVTPVDEVAKRVDALDLVCELPGAFATNGNTPPVFSTPTTPAPTFPPTPYL